MTRCNHFTTRGWAFGAALLLLIGCQGATAPLKFYTLAVPETASDSNLAANPRDMIAVGVGPVEIPKMLDRPQIVTRVTVNRLQLDEFHRWGGSLQEDILRVLTEKLSDLLNTNLVMAHPWGDYFKPDYRIHLIFHRFDGQPGESVVLDATWTITDAGGRQALVVRKSVISEPCITTDFDDLVSAQSRALGALGRQIAQEIAQLEAR